MLRIWLGIWFLLSCSSIAIGFEHDVIGEFVKDAIDTWQLLSPTLIFQDDLPALCMELDWILCFSGSIDKKELAIHLDMIHQQRKQDSVIFIGNYGHENPLKELTKFVPSIFSSNYPILMPLEYTEYIKLRLDSNIIFYTQKSSAKFEIVDQFAVKEGPTIVEVMGTWEFMKGFNFLKSLNRWDRRTNLKGSTMVNALSRNGGNAGFIRDKSGNIIGSTGLFPDGLRFITEKLNLSVKTVESGWDMDFFPNGSWSGEIGFLQRREADVVSTGLGIDLFRSYFIDYPFATDRKTSTLFGSLQKGGALSMWAYVNVFGFIQWMIFIALAFSMIIGLVLINIFITDGSGIAFGTRRGTSKDYKLNSTYSSLALVCLFTIQMGSHVNSKQLAPRLLTLTISFLTLLMFVYYTTDITAEMTSGPPGIPIRTFQDVIYHNYRVVGGSSFSMHILANAKPGTAMREVYENYGETISLDGSVRNKRISILMEVIKDPKRLLYAQAPMLPRSQSERKLLDQILELKMDDVNSGYATLALQRDSEFLPLFNHYIMKMKENGLLRKLYRDYHSYLFARENFEMVQPQPLGFNNVMFPFICLVVGVCLSITKAITEHMIMKLKLKRQKKRVTLTQSYQQGAVEPQIGKKNEKPQNKTKIEVAVENEDKMVTGSVNMSVQDEPADIMGDALHQI